MSFLERVIGYLLARTRWDALLSAVSRHRPDFIWSGSNDFDGSNILTWWAATQDTGLPIIRTYKEHRCCFLLDEKNALLRSDALVLPSHRNLAAFESIYRVPLRTKTIIGDEDWRYSGLVQHVSSRQSPKLSISDGMPHVVILTGVATYGAHDIRRNSRYNYLDVVNLLVQRGIHVHLHAKSIVESTQRPVVDPQNPYQMLAEQHLNFHIEPPLDLENRLDDYLVLSRYDAGLLHNFVSGESVSAFTKMNVPNRLFEYQIAGVLPIVLTDAMLDVEDVVAECGFGIVAPDYIHAADQLKDLVRSGQRREGAVVTHTFSELGDRLLDAFRLAHAVRSRSP